MGLIEAKIIVVYKDREQDVVLRKIGFEIQGDWTNHY